MNVSSRSLTQAIFTNQVILVFLSMSVIVPVVYMLMLFDLEDRAQKSNKLLATAVSAQVAEFLNTPELLLKSLSLHEKREQPTPLSQQRELMDRLIDQTNAFDAIYLLSPENRVKAVGLPLSRRAFRGDYEDIYHSSKGVIEKARSTQRAQWSNTFLSVLSSTSLELALPQRHGDVVVGLFSIEQLSRYVQTLDVGSDTLTFIVDGRGQLIAFPDPSVAQQQLNISNQPLIASTLRGEERTGELIFSQRSYLASTRKVPAMDWIVVAAQPFDNITHDIQTTLFGVFLAALFAIALALLISRLLADKLARPFMQLTLATEQLQQGNFDFIFPKSSVREVQVMSQSFERMARELRVQQRSLSDSERKYRDLVNKVPCVIYRITAVRGEVDFIGSAIEALTGYKPHDFIEGKHIRLDDLIIDEDQQKRQILIQNRCASRQPWQIEYRLRHCDGSIRWVYEEGAESFDEQTGQAYRDAMIIDNTHRRQAERQQQEQIEFMLTLLDTVPSPIYYKNQTGEYLGCNHAFETYFDITQADLIGKKAIETDSLPVTQQALADGDAHLLHHLATQSDDLYLNVAGQARFITLKRASFSNAEGAVAGMVGVIYDLTDRVKAERESRQLRLYLGNVIDSMPSILFAISDKLEVMQVNRAGRQRMHAAGIDQPSYKDLLNQFGLQDHWVVTALAEDQTATLRRHPRAGIELVEDITIYPLDSSVGGGAVLRIDDVTDQIRIEEMMAQSEKMLSVGGLAAGMAHEINNPLAGILQNTQVLKNRLNPGFKPNQRAAKDCNLQLDALLRYLENRSIPQMLAAIEESGKRAARIVENMLSFSRKGDSDFVPVLLQELLDQTIELSLNDYDLKHNYNFGDITIVRDYAPMGAVRCSPSKLQQVFFNLIKNSAQAMVGATGPLQLTLRLRPRGESAHIEIEDSGPGISPDAIKRVFEPFFTTKGVGIGTGLGLSVSYFIVTENHKGNMWVESSLGKGAKFIIELPLHAPPAQPA